MKIILKSCLNLSLLALFLTAICLPTAEAKIDGIVATTFNLTAREGHISTAEGNSLYAWGYANGAGSMQYPGVTMIVNQGDDVTETLTNPFPATSGTW